MKRKLKESDPLGGIFIEYIRVLSGSCRAATGPPPTACVCVYSFVQFQGEVFITFWSLLKGERKGRPAARGAPRVCFLSRWMEGVEEDKDGAHPFSLDSSQHSFAPLVK